MAGLDPAIRSDTSLRQMSGRVVGRDEWVAISERWYKAIDRAPAALRNDRAVPLPHYEIVTKNPGGVGRGVIATTVDGVAVGERPFALKMQDDGVIQYVLVRLG